MKLFIQIPAFNEEETLAQTVADLPKSIPGIDEIRVLVSDDGSTDRTVEMAKELGVDYIVTHRRNVGLAQNYRDAMQACLFLGADIVVNTDGDNQYYGPDVAALVKPIIEGRADYVVGCRDIDNHREFSPLKKRLQHLGSFVVRTLSATDIPDATSGFRAVHRDLAMRLNVLENFSYTIETLIQAGNSRARVGHVPIRVNGATRPSRLFRSTWEFISRQLVTMLRIFMFYAPVKVFAVFAALWTVLGLVFTASGLGSCSPSETGLTPSLFFGGLFLALAACSVMLGGLASNMAGNRMLLTELRSRILHQSLVQGIEPPLFRIIDNTGNAASNESKSTEAEPTPDLGA